MPQFATVTGNVSYLPGDGTPLEIPKGRVEVNLSHDSATLSWEQAKGVTGVTAIPRMLFDEYVQDGKIMLHSVH